MPPRTRSPLVVALTLLFAVVISACANDVELPTTADPVVREGLDIYRQRCSQCHGSDGGGGIGTALRGVEDRLDPDELTAVIVNGRKAMPRFDSTISAAEVDAVIRFITEAL